MAITLTNADNALKSVYLDAISEQLDNNISPFFASIEKSTNDVWGKDVKKLAIYGMNGGVGAGTEDGDLPTATGNNYKQFVSTLKNLYGTIEISDKAIRASENNAGAFVSLLNAEMDGLIKSSKFNFGRMLFGDGSGILGTIKAVENGVITVDNINNFMEGMVIDVYTPAGMPVDGITNRRILYVDRLNKTITISGSSIGADMVDMVITVQGSYQNEITGLKAIFDDNSTSLYGLNKEENKWVKPFVEKEVGEITENKLLSAIDYIEQISGSAPNMILCSMGVRRALHKVLSKNSIALNTMEIAGGYKTMSFNGIPIVADRFCPEGTIYLLNTSDFTLHQLCDWQWLSGDDGKILKQVASKPTYTATLVKYAELICSRPYAQGALLGVSEE